MATNQPDAERAAKIERIDALVGFIRAEDSRYTPEPECLLTASQVQTLRRKAEVADKLVEALRDAAGGYYSPVGRIRVCNRCGGQATHRGWCPVPKWEAILAEYEAADGT
jgi:hypothetical protein